MQIFLSHSDANEALARRVASALEQAGFTVWNAESILPGDNWATAVGKALESSELMVVLFTREAKDSPSLRRDVQYALTSGNYRGRVVPVLVDFVAIEAGNDVPWVLLGMNPVYLNRVGNPSNLDVSQIVERVSAVAEGANAG
jgi:hypothetical protein